MTKQQVRDCIGIFDSGVGGLTVMRQIIRDMPHEDIIYFGDTARLPYGGKSKETILRYSIENAIFLMEKNIKLLVVACNTACSAQAIERLQQIFNIPIIGVIEPGVKKAVNTTKTGAIAVLGTKTTIQSEIYKKRILDHIPHANVISVPCPLLVHIVEEKYIEHSIAEIMIDEYLKPIKGQNVDTIVLGCTHYPLLSHIFQTQAGNNVTLVDSGVACAQAVLDTLHTRNLCTPKKTHGQHRYYVSDDPEKFRSLSQTFLGSPISSVELAAPGI